MHVHSVRWIKGRNRTCNWDSGEEAMPFSFQNNIHVCGSYFQRAWNFCVCINSLPAKKKKKKVGQRIKLCMLFPCDAIQYILYNLRVHIELPWPLQVSILHQGWPPLKKQTRAKHTHVAAHNNTQAKKRTDWLSSKSKQQPTKRWLSALLPLNT